MNNPPIIPFPEQPARLIPQTPHESPAPLPGGMRRQLPRLFEITYDARRFHLKERHTMWGTRYPNGMMTLENGVVFPDGLTELQEYFKRAGNFEMRWVSVMEVADAE